MPVLPPLAQEFDLSAVRFIAGISEMIAETDRLATSIDVVITSTARLSGTTDAGSAADTGFAEAADRVTEALERQFELTDTLAVAMQEATLATEANTAALEAQATAADTSAAATDTAATSAGVFGTHGKTALLAFAGAAIYAVVSAAKFQSQVTRLYTAAGLTHAVYGRLSQQILAVGDATGFTGTKIAEALYHPVSAGLSLAAALKTVTYAAELAQIHGADLTTTTYALSSVMKAYNVQAGQVGKTSALLNAIVGQGDMTFGDFVESVKNWAPTGAAMGISIQSMGTALAYLTDRGNSAEVASTRLTMGLSMVTSGSKAANEYLSALGLTTGTLALRNQTLQQVMLKAGLTTNKIAADLRRPDGIYMALTSIQGAFRRAGLSASQADEVMAKIFGGGRSDKAMVSLMQNLDQLRVKYDAIGQAVGGYGSSWAKTQETVSFEWHKTLAGLQNLAISFGQILLPAVQRVLTVLADLFAYIQANPVLRVLAGVVVALAVAMGVATAAAGALSAAVAAAVANPISLAVMAIVALIAGLYELYKHCKLVHDAVDAVGRFFAGAWREAVQLAGDAIRWFDGGPLTWIKQQIAIFTAWWSQHHQQIAEIASVVWHRIQTQIIPAWEAIWHAISTGLSELAAFWRAHWTEIHAVLSVVWAAISATVGLAIHTILDTISLVLDVLQGKWGAAWGDIEKLASEGMHATQSVITSVASNFGSLLYAAGQSLLHGLISGIESMVGAVMGAVRSIASDAVAGAKLALGIHSPSTVFAEIGRNIGTGMALGIGETAQQVRQAAARLAAEARGAFAHGQITGGQETSLLGRITARLHAGLAEITRRRAEFAQRMQEIGLAMAAGLVTGMEGSVSQIRSAAAKLVTLIRDAFTAGAITDRRATTLTEWVERDSARLQALAARRAAILQTITAARNYAATTASGVVSWAGLSGITSALPAGGAVTGGALLAGLQQDLAKIRQFNAAIRRLAKLGLNKALLNQIIQAGPDAGLQLALAILDGPVSQIAAMNKTETAIEGQATALGQTAANAMYDAGKYAGRGFLSGLEQQQKAIEHLMEQIARAMLRTLRKELGIKSPSSVAHYHGLLFAQGLAQGLDDGRGLVDAAMTRLGGAVRFRPGSIAPGGGVGGGGVLNVQIDVHMAGGYIGSNEELATELARAVQPALLRLQDRNPVPQFPGR